MKKYLSAVLALGLSACIVDTSNQQAVDNVYTPPRTGVAANVTQTDYETLTPLQKYAVVNKLLGTLYKGMPAKDFLEFKTGQTEPELEITGNYLDIIRQKLKTPVDNYAKIIEKANLKYFTQDDGNLRWDPMEMPLTYMYELPLSEEYYNFWIAYQLTNTILFSPALELDSTDRTDVETVFNNLYSWMLIDLNIRDIVYLHVTSEENWRRFRSPEDNTREMMEIFLKRFRDDEVPKAAIACKNWYLTDDSQNYQLIKTVDINQDPQTLLDTNDIVTCEDFYRTLANHPSLIPAVTSRIVEYMLPYSSKTTQNELTQAIVNSNPKTFRDIFTALIFSRTYLYQEEKIQRFEETFFNIAGRIDWYAYHRFFDYLTRNDAGAESSRRNLTQMKQRAMSYKLGRTNTVPDDTLSMAYYQGAVRFNLFLDSRKSTDPENTGDGGWMPYLFLLNEEVLNLTEEEQLDYFFIAVLSRHVTQTEKDTLLPILENKSIEDRAFIVFDYFSRLPELYVFKAISTTGGNA